MLKLSRLVWLQGIIIALLTLHLLACGDNQQTADTDSMDPSPGQAPPATAEKESTAKSPGKAAACHPRMQKLMDALPTASVLEGLAQTERDCSGQQVTARVTYGSGESRLISFDLAALQYSESIADSLGPEAGQALLDNLRAVTEAKIETNRALVKVVAANTQAGMSSMSNAEQALLPREVILPNGAKAMISAVDGGEWEMTALFEDRYLLLITWLDTQQDHNTDQAAAMFSRLAKQVAYEKL